MFRIRSSYKYNINGIELLKVIKFLKNLGQAKKKLKKIGFIYYYEIFLAKKLLGHI